MLFFNKESVIKRLFCCVCNLSTFWAYLLFALYVIIIKKVHDSAKSKII